MRKLLFLLLPLLFFTAAYYAPLNSRELIEPDETRYAEICREMIASGNWIMPQLVGVRYFEKPPMGYWLMAWSVKCFGETPFALRLPSVIASALTAFLIFILTWQGSLRVIKRERRKGREKKRRREINLQEVYRLFTAAGGRIAKVVQAVRKRDFRAVRAALQTEAQLARQDRLERLKREENTAVTPFSPLTTALLASLVYLSCSGVFAIGTTAVLDSPFTFFLSASLASFFFAIELPSKLRWYALLRFFFLISAGFFCACAFLTKGFLAFVLPALIFWLIYRSRFAALFTMIWLPLLTASFLVFPWVLQIHWWDNDFWNYFFWQEHIGRFMSPNDNQHQEPFWYFLLHAPVLFLPWIMVIPAAALGLFRRKKIMEEQRERQSLAAGEFTDHEEEAAAGGEGAESAADTLLEFSLFWLVIPLIFFSASGGKLLTYILPCAPPFAILTALGLSYFFGQEEHGLFQAGVVLSSAVAFVSIIILIYLQIFGLDGLRSLSTVPGGTPLFHNPYQAGLAGISLGVMLLLFTFTRYSKGISKAFVFALSPLLFFICSWYAVPDTVAEKKMPAHFLEKYQDIISNEDIILVDESSLRAVSWYWRRTDLFAVGWAGELTYGMQRDDAKIRGMERIVPFTELPKILAAHPNRVIVVGRSKHIDHWLRLHLLPKPMFRVQSGADGYVILRL